MHKLTDQTPIQLGRVDSVDHVVSALRTHGLALVTGITGRTDTLALGQALGTVRTHRDSDSYGVTAIAQRSNVAGQVGMGGFSDRDLSPHTDGSALQQPPKLLIMTCIHRAADGGDTVLIDGHEIYREIAHTDPGMLDALCAPRSVHFGAGAGFLGSIFQPQPDGRVTVRFRLDDLVRLSPTVSPYLDRLRPLLARQARRRRLDAGEGFVTLNDRWLHGRTRFRGDRLLLRILGDPLPQHAIPAGFPVDPTEAVADLAAAAPRPVESGSMTT